MQQTPVIAVHLGNSLVEKVRCAERLSDIGRVVADFLNDLPCGVEMVFGPITRGGIIRPDPKTGIEGPSYRENLKALEKAITARQKEGRVVLNQLVFKPIIDKHRKIWLSKHSRTPNTWFEPLKHEFYAPILATEKVIAGHFILDWRKGKSAKFAYEVLAQQNKDTFEYPDGIHPQKIKKLAA